MIWFQFVLAVLFTWRISAFLVLENGPLNVFADFRNFVGVKYDEHSNPYGTNFLSELFSCIWCVSVWVSFATVIFIDVSNIRLFILYWLSISAGAILVDSLVRRN